MPESPNIGVRLSPADFERRMKKAKTWIYSLKQFKPSFLDSAMLHLDFIENWNHNCSVTQFIKTLRENIDDAACLSLAGETEDYKCFCRVICVKLVVVMAMLPGVPGKKGILKSIPTCLEEHGCGLKYGEPPFNKLNFAFWAKIMIEFEDICENGAGMARNFFLDFVQTNEQGPSSKASTAQASYGLKRPAAAVESDLGPDHAPSAKKGARLALTAIELTAKSRAELASQSAKMKALEKEIDSMRKTIINKTANKTLQEKTMKQLHEKIQAQIALAQEHSATIKELSETNTVSEKRIASQSAEIEELQTQIEEAKADMQDAEARCGIVSARCKNVEQTMTVKFDDIVGRKNARINKLKTEIEGLRSKLADAETRIERLVEAGAVDGGDEGEDDLTFSQM